ncbi:iron-containing alcohol dehydrogenase [Corticicoccus populi]|uniref:Iron-containing alcohol dehydrogenase n=1 Tax=Corticicoccus populi TaxID=1812821 RepID=A0ABW5WXP2_9STAP
MMNSISNFRTAHNIISGIGSIAQIEVETQKLKAQRAVIITDKIILQTGLVDKVSAPLKNAGVHVDIIDEVVPEPPFENIESIYEEIKKKAYDLFIGIGGGSALDVTKVLAVMPKNEGDIREYVGIDQIPNPGVNTILIPTTSGTGSEVTFNAIFTDKRDNVKKGIVSPYLLPNIAIVDPMMTLTAPPSVTAATGLDALVHAIESYTAINANELTDGIARHAVQLISKSLRQAVFNGNNIPAREDMSMGSLMAGISLANAGVGAVHALAYPLGGQFHIPHGVANALLLPYVMEYNKLSNLEKFAQIAEDMGENIDGLSLREAADRAVKAMSDLSKDIGIPSTLKDVGVKQEDLSLLAEEASKVDRLLNNNPRKLKKEEIETIYQNAFAGVK